MSNPRPTRERDEEVLNWIALRCAGYCLGQINGPSSSAISQATSDVMKADLNLSDEPKGAVRAAYW